MSMSLRLKRQALSGAAALLLAAGSILPAKSATPPDTLVLAAAIDDIISLDPGAVLEITSGEIMGNTYDRLVRFDAKNPSMPRGDVAESWTISADGLTYTFKIKPGLLFASGNPVTAEDVAFTFQRVVKMDKRPSFLLTQLGLSNENVDERAKAMPDGTFVLVVDKPYAPSFVLNAISTNPGGVVDKKLVMANERGGDFGHAWLNTNYAGSGPMKLREWRANEILVLERNEKYYGGAPKLARVIYRHVKESPTQRLLLEQGDVDIARNLEPGDLEMVAKSDKLSTVSALNGTLYYISLNLKNPNLAKPGVREALKYLVDYDAIGATLIKGIGVIHQDFMPMGLPGSTGEKPYKLDVAKAKALLEKAGFGNGLSITFDVRNNQPVTGIAESFQRTASQAGVKIDIIPGNGKQTLTKYRARKHDLYIGEWSLKFWDSHANADAFAYTPEKGDDAKYQTLAWRNGWDANEETIKTAAALLEKDPAKRVAMYHDLLKTYHAGSPFIFIYQMQETAGISKNVKGFILGPVPYTNFVYLASKS